MSKLSTQSERTEGKQSQQLQQVPACRGAPTGEEEDMQLQMEGNRAGRAVVSVFGVAVPTAEVIFSFSQNLPGGAFRRFLPRRGIPS